MHHKFAKKTLSLLLAMCLVLSLLPLTLLAQDVAEKSVSAGVRGILNFAPVALSLPPAVAVRNMYVTDELRSLIIKMKE